MNGCQGLTCLAKKEIEISIPVKIELAFASAIFPNLQLAGPQKAEVLNGHMIKIKKNVCSFFFIRPAI